MTGIEYRALRKALRATQAELADMMGIGLRTVERIESDPDHTVPLRDQLAMERLAQRNGLNGYCDT